MIKENKFKQMKFKSLIMKDETDVKQPKRKKSKVTAKSLLTRTPSPSVKVDYTWKKKTVRELIASNQCSIIKISESKSEKMDWENLSEGHQLAFREVIKTFRDKKETHDDKPEEPEGLSFAYSDDKTDLSAVCISKEGRLILFYKELEV